MLSALRTLPQEQWPEVLNFVSNLRHFSEPARPTSKQLTVIGLAQSDLVGIWADCSAIEDSLDFARQLRSKAEHI